MSYSPKFINGQAFINKKYLGNANLTKRNKAGLKLSKYVPNNKRLKSIRKQRMTTNQNTYTMANHHISIERDSSNHRERRPAKSLDLRRKENGNYIASIYPPEFALARPRVVNESIEKELVEFMQENEEKFGRSEMNKKYVFPRKYFLPTEDNSAPRSAKR